MSVTGLAATIRPFKDCSFIHWAPLATPTACTSRKARESDLLSLSRHGHQAEAIPCHMGKPLVTDSTVDKVHRRVAALSLFPSKSTPVSAQSAMHILHRLSVMSKNRCIRAKGDRHPVGASNMPRSETYVAFVSHFESVTVFSLANLPLCKTLSPAVSPKKVSQLGLSRGSNIQ
jgi:hypothetical protein